VLQCVAVCCSMLQLVAVLFSEMVLSSSKCVLQCVVVRNLMQCVAVCCSMLQYVAVCCSVLQCDTMCCSVMQCVAV